MITRQRTVKRTVSVEGIGLQTGRKVVLTLKSAPADSGISFVRVDLPDKPSVVVKSGISGLLRMIERRTALGAGVVQVQTTEHLMAALAGLSIDNITVEMDNEELPGLDGSARDFLELIRRAQVTEQDAPKKVLKVKKAAWVEGQESLLAVFPSDDFKISYTMSYRDPALGTHFFSITVDEESFASQIAPARTFCLESEALELLKRGFGKGANHENTLVIGKDGLPSKNAFRFPDEPVRHKVLDLIGDLYVVGAGIKGHFVGIKSGHRLNMELARRLEEMIG